MERGELRALLEAQGDGVLATLSARREGWPFASVVQFALTPDGEPLLLLSSLAEHTRNIASDPRASLLVHDRSVADPLGAGRVTLLGRLQPIEDDHLTRLYVERHPQARQYLALADFRFYVLRVAEARFVAGFGDMGWISGDRLRRELQTDLS